MITIIYSHPWDGSFNKAILDRLTAKLESKKKPYQVIDLHKDNFNPTMTIEELEQFGSGDTPYQLTKKYQEMLSKTTKVVFIFPIWWSTIPAILKGFFDKVMLKGFAYNDEKGINPLLKVNTTMVITTSDAPTSSFEKVLTDSMFSLVFKQIGFNNVKLFNKEFVTKVSNESREEFLKEVENYVCGI